MAWFADRTQGCTGADQRGARGELKLVCANTEKISRTRRIPKRQKGARRTVRPRPPRARPGPVESKPCPGPGPPGAFRSRAPKSRCPPVAMRLRCPKGPNPKRRGKGSWNPGHKCGSRRRRVPVVSFDPLVLDAGLGQRRCRDPAATRASSGPGTPGACGPWPLGPWRLGHGACGPGSRRLGPAVLACRPGFPSCLGCCCGFPGS